MTFCHFCDIANKMVMKKYMTLSALMLLAGGFAGAQTPELIKEDTSIQEIQHMAASAGKIFFSARREAVGPRYPCLSDGTSAGTKLLKEVPISTGGQFTEYNGKTCFRALDNSENMELWITDGTEAGTVMIKDINPAGTGCYRIIGVLNGKLCFTGDDGVHGRELWVTDGTEAGTVMLKDINPGNGHAFPATQPQTGIYNGRLYFGADDGSNGTELWVTDGTEAGTVLLKDIHTTGDGDPAYFTVVNDKLFFMALSAGEGGELWVTDGTGAGTVLVKDINPGTASSFPGSMRAWNGKLYFTVYAGFDFANPQDLWVSDGTAAGTVLFEDSAIEAYAYNGSLFFGKVSGYTAPSYEYSLYKTDGTPGNAVLVKELTGGRSKSRPHGYTEAGGRLYFLANFDAGGALYQHNDLWVTDGTAGNTQLVQHADGPPATVSSVNRLVKNNGSLYFTEDNYEDDNNRSMLYKIAGTEPPSGILSHNVPVADVQVYPNPSGSVLNIGTSEKIETINIYSITGELVQTETQRSFSVAHLPSGVYLLCILTSKGVTTTRLLKE